MTVLVISIDGVAPRHVSRTTMPTVCAIARNGAGCFSAETIRPTWTLPAHISMVRGVDPSVHGVLDNTPAEPAGEAPSFLKVCRAAGLRTASVTTWAPLEVMFEADAATTRLLFDDGYNPDIDQIVVDQTRQLLDAGDHDVIFSYFVTPDLTGHDHGWDSSEYVQCLSAADDCVAALVEPLGPEDSILVTTDHGGLGNHHEAGRPEDVRTFVAAMSPMIAAGGMWTEASILDVAPTACALAGVEPDPTWVGSSLLGRAVPIADCLMDLLGEMRQVSYGEDVTMLEHSLQTAALAAQSELFTDPIEAEALGLAGLLHDIGHLLEPAGPFGVVGHASGAADFLQPWLSPEIVEPIRGHVDAKRWLVTRRKDYAALLSEASQATLALQGGPFDEAQCAAFESVPNNMRAVTLREFDDRGKDPTVVTEDLAPWRPRLARWLAPQPSDFVDPLSLLRSCACAECVDPVSGQRLDSGLASADWALAGPAHPDSRTVALRCLNPGVSGAERHLVERADSSAEPPVTFLDPTATVEALHVHWGRADTGAVAEAARLVSDSGVAVLRGVGSEPGTVLSVASAFGHVRATNYGTLFDVVAKPDPENLAYSALGLGLHTDNPYREPCPSVQLLHCLVADPGGGGVTVLADGFAAATALRAEHRSAFDTLTDTPVRFSFESSDVSLSALRPVIECTPWGTVTAVNVNDRSMQRSSDSARSARFRRALDLFQEKLQERSVPFALESGDVLFFDNRRVLHGRTAFSGTERHLQGCYIDMDSVRSLAAVAQR